MNKLSYFFWKLLGHLVIRLRLLDGDINICTKVTKKKIEIISRKLRIQSNETKVVFVFLAFC